MRASVKADEKRRNDVTEVMELAPAESLSPSSGLTRGRSTTSSTNATATATSPTSFTSVKELFDSLEDFTASDYVRVNNFSIDDFRAIEELRDSECRKLRFFYERQSTTLIITIPTLPHEILHRRLNKIIEQKLDAMGMEDQYEAVGATTYTSTSGQDLQTSLEGDSCLIPVSRTGRDVWPVLVIEAGCSQTEEELSRIKARAWFLASNFEVKTVILAKMFTSEGRIMLEKWKGVEVGNRTGTVRTRANRKLI